MFSECDKDLFPLLTLIVKQHRELVTQTELVEKLSDKLQCHKCPPVLQGVHADVEINSMTVMWAKGDENIAIDKYHIKYDTGSDSESEQIMEVNSTDVRYNGRFNTVRISELKPWERYQISICAENSVGWGEWSEPLKVVLNKSPPPKPTEVSVNVTENPDTNSDKLHLQIDQPIHCESLVKEYKLTYQDEKGGPITHTDKVHQTYNATFILPFPKGSFRNLCFSLKNKYGWGSPSDAIHASDLRPSRVQMFAYVIGTITQDSVELMWEEPSTNSTIVEYYELKWPTSKKVETTETTVFNLHPDTEYRFRVTPITKFGSRGETSEELLIKTKPATA